MLHKSILLASFILIKMLGFGQDSSATKRSYYSVNSVGFESGSLTEELNLLYLQSLHGIKFDEAFGIAAGPTLIVYERYKFLPLVLSVRRSPTSKHRFGYNFDIGYNAVLSGKGTDFQENFELTKGGSYFHPQISGLVYDGDFTVYMNLGYRVYSFTETYNDSGFIWPSGVTYEDRITARFITIGVTFEIE